MAMNAFVNALLLKKSHSLMVQNLVVGRSPFQVRLKVLMIDAMGDAILLKESSLPMIRNFVVLVNVHLVEVVLGASQFQVRLTLRFQEGAKYREQSELIDGY